MYEVSVDRLRVWERDGEVRWVVERCGKRHRSSRRRQRCRESNHPPFVKFENAALKIQTL